MHTERQISCTILYAANSIAICTYFQYLCMCVSPVNGKIKKRAIEMIHKMFEYFFHFVMKLANVDNKSSTPVNFGNFYQYFIESPVKRTNFANRILWIIKKEFCKKN